MFTHHAAERARDSTMPVPITRPKANTVRSAVQPHDAFSSATQPGWPSTLGSGPSPARTRIFEGTGRLFVIRLLLFPCAGTAARAQNLRGV